MVGYPLPLPSPFEEREDTAFAVSGEEGRLLTKNSNSYSKIMDIISISHFFYPRVGGLEKMAYLVLKHLSEKGYSCISIFSSKVDTSYRSEGFLWKSFNTFNLMKGTYPIFGLRSILFIFKIIRKNPNATILIYDRHLLSSVVSSYICRLLRREYILVSQTTYSGFFSSSIVSFIAETLDKTVFSGVVKNAKTVICVSESNKEYMLNKFYNKDFSSSKDASTKFKVIFNTYNNSVKKHTPAVQREKTVVFASKLIGVKDPDTTALAFLSLANDFPEWKFTFIGEGQTILQEIENMPINLEYIPRLLDQASLHELLSRSAIYVNSSLQEGLSLGVIEAAILGNELVLSDAPSNLEILALARAKNNSFRRGDVVSLSNKLSEKIKELESVNMIKEDTWRDEFLELCSQDEVLASYEQIIRTNKAAKEFKKRLHLEKPALKYE